MILTGHKRHLRSIIHLPWYFLLLLYNSWKLYLLIKCNCTTTHFQRKCLNTHKFKTWDQFFQQQWTKLVHIIFFWLLNNLTWRHRWFWCTSKKVCQSFWKMLNTFCKSAIFEPYATRINCGLIISLHLEDERWNLG